MLRTLRFRRLLLEAVAAGGAGLGCATPSPPTLSRADPPPNAGESSLRPAASAPGTRAAPPTTATLGGPGPLPGSSAAASGFASSSRASPARYSTPPGSSGDCPNGSRNVLLDLKPANPFDYAELRQSQGGTSFQVVLARGTPCTNAGDVETCHRELAREASPPGFGSACRPGNCDFHIVVTDGRGVSRLSSSAEVARFLGPIDTPGEALLMAFANKHPRVLACDAKLPQKAGAGWTLISSEMIEECPVVTADLSLSITNDGSVRVLGTTNQKKTGMCVGRRPPGLVTNDVASPSSTASYLAGCAELEAASIVAFQHLGRELSRIGAPLHLTRGCRRAAADERRHARVMALLARRFGSDVAKAEYARPARHTAETLATDNAIEGCVRETFGAAVGLFQARHAKDPVVKAVLGAIARDEMRHADLAFQIARWVEERLDPSARQRMAAARRKAIAELRAELEVEPDSALRETLGVPTATASLRMLAVLEERLWTERVS